jgi:hypothetical protein
MAVSVELMVSDFVAGPKLLGVVVGDMTVEQLRSRPVQGRWSTLEVICHLADSDQAWCHRMKRVIAENKPLLVDYDETAFTARLDYQNRDVREELAMIEVMRGQMARELLVLPGEAWRRQGVHTSRGLVTLEEMVVLETEHIRGHLRHILDKRRALGLAIAEAWVAG